jgi:hypothetical protein
MSCGETLHTRRVSPHFMAWIRSLKPDVKRVHFCHNKLWKKLCRLFFPASIHPMEKKKLHGLSPRANYTDRATAASRRSVANSVV